MVSVPAVSPPSDPALVEDLRFLRQKLLEAIDKGGITFGFNSSSKARSFRRRLYYLSQMLEGVDRQRVNQLEFKHCGRMIAFVPKQTLSSFTQGETDGAPSL